MPEARDMDIGECMCRLEGYGYAMSEKYSATRRPRNVYMDGHGLRLSLVVNSGTVTGIACYLLKCGAVDRLLGTTAVFPTSIIKRQWVTGIGMDEMLSILSEPGKAVMRFGAMRLEEELDVLEG